MTFSMAVSETIILISQWSHVDNSCHVAPLTGSHGVTSGNRWAVLVLRSSSTASLWVSWDCYISSEEGFSGSSSTVRSWLCLPAIWPRLIAFEECCRARFTSSFSSPGLPLSGGRLGLQGWGWILPCCGSGCLPATCGWLRFIMYLFHF